MTAKYELSAAAAADIEGILSASLETFGDEQTQRYVATLEQCLTLLAMNPAMGASAVEIRAGYRRFPHESHTIFYIEIPRGIRGVRVLHQRMDVVTQFNP